MPSGDRFPGWRRHGLGVLCAASSALLPAAEQEVRDWRLVVESRPQDLRYTWDDRLGARQGDGSFDQAWAVGVGMRWGWGRSGTPHRWLAGGEALYLREASDDLHGQGALLRVEAGYGYALGERLLATVLPLAGGGPLRLTRDAPASGAVALGGAGVEAGLRLGLRWNLTPRWSLAGEAGWLWWRQRVSDADGHLTLTGQGPSAALVLAWTQDPAPRALE